MSDVSPQSGISGLLSDSPFLSLLWFFCLVLLLWFVIFLLMVHFPDFSPPFYSLVLVCFMYWLCRLTWGRVYAWEEFWNVHLLMTEFDCTEVTLCGWQDIIMQLLTNLLLQFIFWQLHALQARMPIAQSHNDRSTYENTFVSAFEGLCEWESERVCIHFNLYLIKPPERLLYDSNASFAYMYR